MPLNVTGDEFVIPLPERYSGLQDFLLEQTESVTRIKNLSPTLIPGESPPFLFLISPWIIQPPDKGAEASLAAGRHTFEAVGFKGATVAQRLAEILDGDKHLRECCANVGQLAQFLDEQFIGPSVNLRLAGASVDLLLDRFAHFSKLAYEQGRFRTVGLYHVFNFSAFTDSLRFDDMRIERLERHEVSRVLGEPTSPSFLHPAGIGDYFIVLEREGPCEDFVSWCIESQSGRRGLSMF